MDSPFTVIRGGQSKPAPTEFARFDRSRVIIDRLKVELITDRDRAITNKRFQAKQR